MKITDVKTTLLSVPHLEPEFVSTGIRKGVTQALIEIETDEGIVGLGESVCRPNARVIEAAIESCKPFLIGADPRNIEAIVNNLRHVGGWAYFERVGNMALGGIETALWGHCRESLWQAALRVAGRYGPGPHASHVLSASLRFR